jgi:hypothetical protein
MTKKRKPQEQDPNTDLFTNEDHSEEDTVTEKKNKNGKEI